MGAEAALSLRCLGHAHVLTVHVRRSNSPKDVQEEDKKLAQFNQWGLKAGNMQRNFFCEIGSGVQNSRHRLDLVSRHHEIQLTQPTQLSSRSILKNSQVGCIQ